MSAAVEKLLALLLATEGSVKELFLLGIPALEESIAMPAVQTLFHTTTITL